MEDMESYHWHLNKSRHSCLDVVKRMLQNVSYYVVVVAIGVRVVEVGATCGIPGHRGIEARRRACVVRFFSSAPWVHDPPVGY